MLGPRFLVLMLSLLVPAVATAQTRAHTPPAARAAGPVARAPLPSAPPGVTAFVNVAVIPMDTERVLANQTVLVEGGWITALGPSSRVKVPAGAIQVDGRGKFLLPGFADMHVHLTMNPNAREQQPGIDGMRVVERRLLRNLSDGITTVRDVDYRDRVHGAPFSVLLDGADLLRLRARIAAGELLGPRLYVSGPWGPPQYANIGAFWNGPQAGKYAEAATLPPAQRDSLLATLPPRPLDSVLAYVTRYKAAGYDHLKVHNEELDVFRAVLIAARKVGMPVVGHVPSGGLSIALAEGMRSVEHFEGYEYPTLSSARTAADTAAVRDTVRVLAAATARAGLWTSCWASGSRAAELAKALQDAGAGLLLGSDDMWSWFIDYSPVHAIIQHTMLDAGLTPYQALLTTTRNVAQYYGILDSAGTVAVGKRADLVLLHGNPLREIYYTNVPAGVMVAGRWVPRAELERRLLAGSPEEQKQYYQEYDSMAARPYGFLMERLRQGAGGPPPTAAQESALTKLDQAMATERTALVDSLFAEAKATGADTVAYGPARRRFLHLAARQLGELRRALLPAQRPVFDGLARVLVRQYDLPGSYRAISAPPTRSARSRPAR